MAETAEAVASAPAQATNAVAGAVEQASTATEEFDPNTLITALVLIAVLLAVVVVVQVYMQHKDDLNFGGSDDSEED